MCVCVCVCVCVCMYETIIDFFVCLGSLLVFLLDI